MKSTIPRIGSLILMLLFAFSLCVSPALAGEQPAGDSALSSLTLEEGAVLTAPEGMELTIFTDADASNANTSYEGGTQEELLDPGTYGNVIITVS